MKILITFAVEAEFAPWRKLRNLQTVQQGEITLYRAQIGRSTADFVVTGMGIENATRVTELALTESHQFCISSGFAGALRPGFALGDILAARAVQQIGKSITLESSRNLFKVALQSHAKRATLFLTSEQVIRTAGEKAKLAPFAEAVDMESFAVFAVAHSRKCPAVAIRVISDRFDKDLPVHIDTMVDEKGRVSIGGVVRYIAYWPQHLPAVIRLGRDSRTAAEALAHFLEAYIKQISFFTHGWFPEGQNLDEVSAR